MPSDNFVTSFKSWDGVANPTGAFANELGNRLHMGLHVAGNGSQFSISQLGFTMNDLSASGDLSLPSADYPTWGAVGSYGYSAARVGLNYGADGTKGTGDDAWITSGLNTQLIDELFMVGSGNAWWPEIEAGETGQDAIDRVAASLNAELPFTVTGTYTIGNDSGKATVQFGTVPDGGSTLALLACAVGLIGIMRNRCRK